MLLLSRSTPFFEPAIPLTTQSDPGSENYSVANVQTLARHHLDSILAGTLQHCWKRNKSNIKSEANWSVLHRDFSPGFEALFQSGVNQGWYEVDKPLERWVTQFNICGSDTQVISLLFRWLAIPWLQSELDAWIVLCNRTAPRADKKKLLPHGIPELIRQKPEKYSVLDFKIGQFMLISESNI